MSRRDHRGLLLVMCVAASGGCEGLIMRPSPGTSNLEIFDEYARVVTGKFALEDVKGIDLDDVIADARRDVTSRSSPEELFLAMNRITVAMQEPHTIILASDVLLTESVAYDWTVDFPPGFDRVLADELFYGPEADPDARTVDVEDSFFTFQYGRLPAEETLGYMRISAFGPPPSAEQLDEMFGFLADTDGLVVDLRSNIGGSVASMATVASYFTTEPLDFGTNRAKVGPGRDDFVDSSMVLEPADTPFAYTKPTVVLQDRVAFSSGALMPLILDGLDHVTTMGQVSGGGTGEIIEGYLANGWRWVLSSSNLLDEDGQPTDNGVEPQIPVAFDETATAEDSVMEAAIGELLSTSR